MHIKSVKRDPRTGHLINHPAYEGWRPTEPMPIWLQRILGWGFVLFIGFIIFAMEVS